jgi:hypothetical protein
MFEKMNEKDKKTLKMGGIGAVGVLVLFIAVQGYGNWNKKTTEYNSIVNQLNTLNVTDNAHNKSLEIVPVFLMPKDEQTQKTLFRNSLEQLFEQLRINTEPWQDVMTSKSTIITGYGSLRFKTSGTCTFDQILRLLAELRQNPYLVGIEELHVACSPQNPRQAEFNIQVATLTLPQSKRGKL